LEILHRITFNDTAEGGRIHELAGLGVKATFTPLPSPPGNQAPLGLVTAVVSERHEQWSVVRSKVEAWQAGDLITTRFTTGERRQAKWLAVEPEWHCGYPMPDEDDGYLAETYDRSKECPSCNAGRVQKRPFRMAGEPRWGSRAAMQLNWVFDEYFVRPETYRSVFEPFGIPSIEVVDHTTGMPLQTVVQLEIKHIALVPLVFQGDAHGVTCGVCGRCRFEPHVKGFFPSFSVPVQYPLVKTQEVFGSGKSSWHAVLMSSELYSACFSHQVRGFVFWPSLSNTPN